MPFQDIVACKIHPAIGIARIGDSPDGFFIGPETPGLQPDFDAAFKDGNGRIKRQAARFRVYGVDAHGEIVAELTPRADQIEVEWSVHLANRKPSGVKFHEVRHDLAPWAAPPDAQSLRNLDVADRSQLEITPSPRAISGVDQAGAQYAFDDGAFMGEAVYLGELRTDAAGRLLVLGGRGISRPTAGARPLTNYADNDGWHDDVGDGPVTAKVTIAGREIPLQAPAWVIVAPPKFAPYIRNVVSLYEIMAEAGGVAPPQRVSFTSHVYPLFAAVADLQWVNQMALRGHGPQKPGNFRDPQVIAKLNDNGTANAAYRQAVFGRLRSPGSQDPKQATYDYMPLLSGNEGDCEVGKPDTWLSLPASTYKLLERWKDGDFDADWRAERPVPSQVDDLPVAEQPAALDRAALEPCVGGPFFPGIEITYFSRMSELYCEPFRFDAAKLQPGLITARMAVPWQADFYECAVHWWPAQRPDDVLNENHYQRALRDFPEDMRLGQLARVTTNRQKWDRGVGDRWEDPETSPPPDASPASPGDNDMVEKWKQLGFVAPVRTDAGEILMVERGRSCYDGLGDRDYFFYLLNIESYPDFKPKARELAETFIAGARKLLADPAKMADYAMYQRFPYSKDALQQRLDEIYGSLQAQAALDPLADPSNYIKTRDDMVERVRQYAPLNQLDGAWIRHIARTGPIDQVGALLFTIWMDEVGDGNPDQNHANVYTRLLQSVGIQLPPISTADYAYDQRFLDSAFTVPMYELAISEFTDSFYPEILGMTLQLEWEVLGLWPTVKLLRNFGIDPHFYELHIGIDNAANGHGAKAREAVVRFLDEAYMRGGDAEVQAVWQRIWDGYVAFGTTGTLYEDLRTLLEQRQEPASITDRIDAIVLEKKKYGALNHGDRRANGQRINDLFEDGGAFRKALVEGGYIVPGHPEQSRFFKLTSFEGPMYKVFTDDELDAFEQWTFSLGGDKPPVPVETDPGRLMAACIDALRPQQEGAPAHAGFQLIGPDPDQPGSTTTKSVAAWFEAPTSAFMVALAYPANKLIEPGSSATSAFITQWVGASNAMGAAFEGIAPNSGGKTWTQIACQWIDAGCPPPQAAVPTVLESTVAVASGPASAGPSRVKLGMGVVH